LRAVFPLASPRLPPKIRPVKVLITAGPTREPLDPVRFLTNRSSGKMGYTLAGAFAHEGHQVLLVSGPTALDVPEGVDFIAVETAAEMHDVVSRYLAKMDIAVFAAAVADYTPAAVEPQKIKKSGDTLTLELVRTTDILGSARDAGFAGTLVGFAAETENLEANARDKLVRKRCDLVIANDVSQSGIGFDSDENQILLVYPDRSVALPRASKHALSLDLVDAILKLRGDD
jgi:phosphopantothenoylcysteine decarboxylase/phosphopantothenate--cysteine ligase